MFVNDILNGDEMSFLTENELSELGLAAYGNNVKISKNCSIYGSENIHIGDNVRIDDFCILSAGEGGIRIGNYIHIACYVSIIGQGAVSLGDFSGLSSKVAIYSSNDDYSGNAMTNPTVPPEYTNVMHGPVKLNKHVLVGSSSIILPNVELGEGCCIGAQSLVTRNCVDFGIYMGTPAKKIKNRSRKLIDLEKEFCKNGY